MKSDHSRSFRLAFQAFAVAAIAAACSAPAHAARYAITTKDDVAAIYLKAGKGAENGGNLNGQFDSIQFDLKPTRGATFTNISSGAGRPALDPFTYRNRVLDADPLDGGLGWSILGASITPTMFTFGGGPLGGTIDTGDPAGPGLFLANIRLDPPRGGYVEGGIQLLRAGTVIAYLPIIPEPSTGVLGLFALLVLRAAGRCGRTPA